MLLQRLGDVYGTVLAMHDRLLREAVGAAGGTVLKSMGDGVLAVFAESGAAVAAAVEIQRLLAETEWPLQADVRVRAGIHAGPAQAHQEDYTALAVHQAARVTAAAHGGQVLMTAPVQRAAGSPGVELGLFSVRDFDEPISLYALQVPTSTWSATPRALRAGAESFPCFRTSFVGREDAIARIETEFDTHRLVTLVGPGGAGKTRLSVEVANATADALAGQWFVDLTQVNAPGEVLPSVVRALANDAGVDQGFGELARLLDSRAALVVLDNCEHVIDAAAEVADVLLTRCPTVRILATSREPLALPDERVLPLLGLGAPTGTEVSSIYASEAGSLFLARASFDLAVEDAVASEMVAHLLQSLDFLPLAIELIAGMTTTVPLPELAELANDELLAEQHGASDTRGGRGGTPRSLRSSTGAWISSTSATSEP